MRRAMAGAAVLTLIVSVAGAVAGTTGIGDGEAEAVTLAAAHAFQDATFTGHKDGCRKCHLKEHRSWSKTPHASALETLEGDDANNPECLQCHTTGYGEPSGFTSVADTPELAGVTCESCHGPGSGYRDKETMKDLEASTAAGLSIPDEATCLGCHNDQSPNFPGTFDFEEMKAKGVHDIKR